MLSWKKNIRKYKNRGSVWERFLKERGQNMCYLIAKHIDKSGCVALKTIHGQHFSKFKRGIEAKVGYEKIQLVTISRPSAYGEYEPYCFVNTEEEFEKCVVAMQQNRMFVYDYFSCKEGNMIIE